MIARTLRLSARPELVVGALLATLFLSQTFCLPSAGTSLPDNPRPFSGKLVGITDSKGAQIIPTAYSKAEYCGNGIFLMTGSNSSDGFRLGDEKHIFNSRGEELKVVVPPGTKLKSVLWLGLKSEEDDKFMLTELPDDAVLMFAPEEKQADAGAPTAGAPTAAAPRDRIGLCTAKGRVILPLGDYRVEHPGEGFAFLQDKQPRSKTSLLNLSSGKVIPLSVPYVEVRSPMSEGVAIVRNEATRVYGFVDKRGAIKFKEAFALPQPFVGGLSLVQLPSKDPDRRSQSVLIDHKYSVVSPRDLSVSQFCGDYAVGYRWNEKPVKFGLLDRNFKFVREPEFSRLMPCTERTRSRSSALNRGAAITHRSAPVRNKVASLKQEPVFYLAQRFGSDEHIALNPQGEVLFTFPPGITFDSASTDLIAGLIRCTFRTNDEWKTVYLNMQGKEVEAPPAVRQIAPGFFLKIIAASDAKPNESN